MLSLPAWLTQILFIILALFGLTLTPGCGETTLFGKANPRTEFSYGKSGARFYDNKNNQMELSGEYDPVTGAVKITKFSVNNDASGVRLSDVEQNLSLVPQQAMVNQGILNVGTATAQVISTFIPYVPPMIAAQALGDLRRSLSVSTPWGSAGYSNDAQVQALSQIIQQSNTTNAEILKRLEALERSTTKPAAE